MNEERLQEIKDSVDFQREMLLAHNLGTLCVDEEQELIDEIERLNNIIYNLEDKLNKLIEEQLEQYNKRVENWEEKRNVSNTWLTSRDCYYSILKYLQKLKGVDK